MMSIGESFDKLQQIVKKDKNDICANCIEKESAFAFIWMGAFICADCKDKIEATASDHNYWYIKSLKPEDSVWNEFQYKFLELGGNEKAIAFKEDNQIEQIDF